MIQCENEKKNNDENIHVEYRTKSTSVRRNDDEQYYKCR